MSCASRDRARSSSGVLHVRVGIVPLAKLVPVAERLVDDELAVVAERDLDALQRPGRRAFEVDALLRVPRAVAGALELVLGAEPARRAAEVRADAEQRVKRTLRAHDPDALRLHPLLGDVAHRVLGRIARLEAGRRLEEDAGEEKAEDRAARGREAGEDRAPTREGEDVAPRPDEVSALGFGDAWIAARHSTPSVAKRGEER